VRPAGAGDPPLHAPGTAEEFSQLLAASAGKKLLPIGRGTRDLPGALPGPVDGLLSTRRLDRVLHYEPGDLVLTAEAGAGLLEIDELLAEHGQWLPLQPYRRRGTLGGLFASAADSLLELSCGSARDLLLGARVAHGDGLLARARGRVVKNVAGYDLPRLMVGSIGTLGVLLEVTLKLAPRPKVHASAVLGFDTPADALLAAERVRQGPDEPAFVAVFAGACTPQLMLGFDGGSARVAGCRQRAVAMASRVGASGTLLLDGEDDRALRARLDDPPAGLQAPASDGCVLRCSCRPSRVGALLRELLDAARRAGVSVRTDVRPGLGLLFVGLAAGDEAALDAATLQLLGLARAHGHAVLLSAPPRLRAAPDTVWGPPPPDLVLMQRVRRALDPGGVFAGGRGVGGL